MSTRETGFGVPDVTYVCRLIHVYLSRHAYQCVQGMGPQSSRSRGAAERATCIVKRQLHEGHVTARASCAVGRPRTAQRERCAPARMALSRRQFS
eukprot:3143740-Amphidinium_carterae.1